MAVRATREVVFDASPEAILDALADIEEVPSWSTVHHVKATLKIMGVTDKELLEYHWGKDWVVWDATDTFQQRGQHGEYNLTRVGDQTKVRFDIIIDLAAPIPAFLIKRAKKIVLDIAIDRLRCRVTRFYG
jgi:hypothetical protein